MHSWKQAALKRFLIYCSAATSQSWVLGASIKESTLLYVRLWYSSFSWLQMVGLHQLPPARFSRARRACTRQNKERSRCDGGRDKATTQRPLHRYMTMQPTMVCRPWRTMCRVSWGEATLKRRRPTLLRQRQTSGEPTVARAKSSDSANRHWRHTAGSWSGAERNRQMQQTTVACLQTRGVTRHLYSSSAARWLKHLDLVVRFLLLLIGEAGAIHGGNTTDNSKSPYTYN